MLLKMTVLNDFKQSYRILIPKEGSILSMDIMILGWDCREHIDVGGSKALAHR